MNLVINLEGPSNELNHRNNNMIKKEINLKIIE